MLKIIDDNFNLHSRKIPGLTTQMHVFRRGGLSFIDSGLSCDTFNIVHITNGQGTTLSDISEAIAHYTDKTLLIVFG